MAFYLKKIIRIYDKKKKDLGKVIPGRGNSTTQWMTSSGTNLEGKNPCFSVLSHNTQYLTSKHKIPAAYKGFLHQTGLQFSEVTEWVSSSSNYFWLYLPGISIRFHRTVSPSSGVITSVMFHLNFSEPSWVPSFHSVSLQNA